MANLRLSKNLSIEDEIYSQHIRQRAMTDSKDQRQKKSDQKQSEKAARLSEALRENLHKRKNLQRTRGETAPDPIKNKQRLGE